MSARCERRDPHTCTLGRHLDPPKAVRITEKDFMKEVFSNAARKKRISAHCFRSDSLIWLNVCS